MLPADSSAVSHLVGLLTGKDLGGVVSIALTGSSAHGGLRPDSDLDLLAITRRSLSVPERRLMVDQVLQVSGSRATLTPGRPIELTSLSLADVVPWSYPATCDFLYGEWMRPDYLVGRLPEPEVDPNLPVLITSARQHSVQLWGRAVGDLLDPVPEHHLMRSMQDALPALVDDLVGDERNVLLTLARMLVTLETGAIVPKDHAAAAVAPTLPLAERLSLIHAAHGYLGDVADDWTAHDAESAASLLVRLIRALKPLR